MADPLLASDDDRERALVLLRSASVDGRLTVEDLAARGALGTLRVSTRPRLADQIKEQVMEHLRSQPPS